MLNGASHWSSGVNNSRQTVAPTSLKNKFPSAMRRVSGRANPAINAVTPIPMFAPSTTTTAAGTGNTPCTHNAMAMPMAAVALWRITFNATANNISQTG